MAQPPRTVIRKPRTPTDEPDTANAAAAEPPGDSPSESEAPQVEVQRTGPIQSLHRTRPERDSKPATQPEHSSEPAEAPIHQGLDLSGLEALADMDRADLASLLDAEPLQRTLTEGERVRATVSRIGTTQLLVDVGLKAEAQIERSELPDAQVGDTIEAFVVWTDGVETTLSTQLRGDTASRFLDEAKDAGIPVEGLIAQRNSGGFVVRIGDVRAFCPARLIDRHAFGDLDRFLGKTARFLVIETGDKLVVSRRALQEQELAASVEQRWASLAEGDTLTGVVSGVQSFGIFVDCDGLEGLVPRSEASWERSVDLASIFTQGQQVEVRVLAVDRAENKLTFSVKDPGKSPWSRVGVDFVHGEVYPGEVEGVEEYGAFVRLAPGVTGLLHRSTLQGALPASGEQLPVRILSIDHGRRRLELGPPSAEASESTSGEEVSGAVVEVLRNGVVIALDDGRTGWLAESEVDLPAGTILAQRFRRGRTIQARIAEQDGQRGQVKLTQRTQTEAEASRAWRAQSGSDQSGGFGTLGDLLGKWKG